MTAGLPNSYDMLTLYGILPYDVNQIVNDKPSQFLQNSYLKMPNNTLKSDQFNINNKTKTPKDPRKVALAALATYLTGVVLSKGSKNPLKGLQAIGKTAFNIIKLPIKVLLKR